MTIELTEQQQRALDSGGASAIQLVDPRTQAAYVLVPALDFEAVREILEDEKDQKAIRAIALRNAVGRMEEAP